MTGANGEVSFINIKTLNEWDSRVRHAWSPCLWFLRALLSLASLCEPWCVTYTATKIFFFFLLSFSSL